MYQINKPPFGYLATEKLIAALSDAQLSRLREHALALACLDGNAFEELTDQYLCDAYANLWQNSRLDDLPNLYPCSAGEAWLASLDDDQHPNYNHIEPENRAAIRAHFIYDTDNQDNIRLILDTAEDILGDRLKADDWLDQYSSTLGGTPRELSATSQGTHRVLLHLTSISRHYHDA